MWAVEVVASDQENVVSFADALDEIEGTERMCVSHKADGATLRYVPLEEAAELLEPLVEDGVVVVEDFSRAPQYVLPSSECPVGQTFRTKIKLVAS